MNSSKITVDLTIEIKEGESFTSFNAHDVIGYLSDYLIDLTKHDSDLSWMVRSVTLSPGSNVVLGDVSGKVIQINSDRHIGNISF